MLKIVVVPQPENNIVVKEIHEAWLDIYYSNNVDPEQLIDIVKEFGKAYKSLTSQDCITLFVNPVYNKQEVIAFIKELN